MSVQSQKVQPSIQILDVLYQITLLTTFSLLLDFNMNGSTNQNHTLYNLNVNEDSTPLNYWQKWKSALPTFFSAICAFLIVCGKGMIINYIRRHAPIERPINRLVLIDEVSSFNYCSIKLHKQE